MPTFLHLTNLQPLQSALASLPKAQSLFLLQVNSKLNTVALLKKAAHALQATAPKCFPLAESPHILHVKESSDAISHQNKNQWKKTRV